MSPKTGAALERSVDELVSADGRERFPIVRGIPRFVSSDNYAAAFGLEWKLHARTQLDSHTGTQISRQRLERCLGAPLETLRGKKVLEAGCGSGRFTELLVGAGALVHSIDLSVAVEPNQENIGDRPNYRVAQASLLEPPFAPGSFDVVVCLGVLQHTPSTEGSLRSLWRMVKPGGQLVVDHYTWTVSGVTKLAPLYRLALLRMSPEKAREVTDKAVDFFFPLHAKARKVRPAQMLLSRVSPCLVYFNTFPDLSLEQQRDFCRLDTYDHLTDRYKRFRFAWQLKRELEQLGGAQVHASRGGNGVEARCVKPAHAPS